MNTAAVNDMSDVHRALGRDQLKSRLLHAEKSAKNGEMLDTKSSNSSLLLPETDIEDIEEYEGEATLKSKFPLHLLPPVISTFSYEVSKAELVPACLPAACALGTISAAIGAGLVVKSGGSRITPANLFLLPVAASGTGKGRAYHETAKPLLELERTKCEAWKRDEWPHAQAELMVLDNEIQTATRNAGKAKDSIARGEWCEKVRSCLQQKQKLETENREPVWTVGDITREALAEMLGKARNESLASMSAEARGVLDVLAGRYNEASDEDIYLAGYSGDGVKVNRRGSPPIVLNNPRLSILWLLQPDKLDELLSKRALTESGLFPRFLCFDTHTEADYAPENPHVIDGVVKLHWHDLIERLVSSYREHDGEPCSIEPSKSAHDVMREFQNQTVTRRRSGGDVADVGIYAARWCEQAWRLSVVLHAGKHGDAAHLHQLTEHTAREAIELAKWFSVQQLAILQGGRETRKRERLDRLVSLLNDSPAKTLTVRDLDNRHNFAFAELADLAANNPHRIKVEKLPQDGAGRPSRIVRLL